MKRRVLCIMSIVGIVALLCVTLAIPPSLAQPVGGGSPTLPDRPVKVGPAAPGDPRIDVPVELTGRRLCADDLVRIAAEKYGLDPALVKSVVLVESDGNPRAVSPKGAAGCMQLMPGTARDLGVRNRFDPWQNIAAGTQYLAGLLDRFNGDMVLALAGYNAGEGAVEKYEGVPPYPETKGFVRKVLALYRGSAEPKEFSVRLRITTTVTARKERDALRARAREAKAEAERVKDEAYRAHVAERQRIRADINARKEVRRAAYQRHLVEREVARAELAERKAAKYAWALQAYDREAGAAVYVRR